MGATIVRARSAVPHPRRVREGSLHRPPPYVNFFIDGAGRLCPANRTVAREVHPARPPRPCHPCPSPPRLAQHFQKAPTFLFTTYWSSSGWKADSERTTVDHLAFEIGEEDYEAEKARLEGLGVPVTTAEHAWVRWRSLYVAHPEGNNFESACYAKSVGCVGPSGRRRAIYIPEQLGGTSVHRACRGCARRGEI